MSHRGAYRYTRLSVRAARRMFRMRRVRRPALGVPPLGPEIPIRRLVRQGGTQDKASRRVIGDGAGFKQRGPADTEMMTAQQQIGDVSTVPGRRHQDSHHRTAGTAAGATGLHGPCALRGGPIGRGLSVPVGHGLHDMRFSRRQTGRQGLRARLQDRKDLTFVPPARDLWPARGGPPSRHRHRRECRRHSHGGAPNAACPSPNALSICAVG